MDFELKIIEFLQSGRNAFFDLFFQTISNMGSVFGFVFLLLVFFRINKRYAFVFCSTYLSITLFVNLVLKNVFERLRPYVVSDTIMNIGSGGTGYSFPSGHAVSACVLAMFAVYLFLILSRKKSTKVISVIIGILFISLVCLSRMYLGKHFLTDVIAGVIIAGLFSIMALIYFHKRFVKRKIIIVKKKG